MAVEKARITWNGKRVRAKEKAGAVRALEVSTEHLLRVSDTRVPHEEGTLQNSGVASVDEATLTGAVSYDTEYAVDQHENFLYHHDPGRTAKYLEGPAHEERRTILELMAAELRRALR